MQIRTYIGVLLGVVLVVEASAVSLLNQGLLFERFSLTSDFSIPVYGAFVLVFLLGCFPPLTVLLVQSLRRDLTQRRERRRNREAKSAEQRLRRAIDCQRDGQYQRAATELEAVLAEKPEAFSTLLRYGEILRLLGRHREALDVHRRASVLYPQSVSLLYQLAVDYEEADPATGGVDGDGAQIAHEIRNRILRDFPGFGLQVLRRRRDTAMAAGRWDAAMRWHDKIGTLGSGEMDDVDAAVRQGLTYQRALALLESDRADEAAPIFRQLLEEEERFVPAAIMLGEALLLLDDEAAALESWRRGFKATGSPVFLQRLEDYFIEISAPDRAIEMLHGLITQVDKDLLPMLFLGRLYYRIEMLDEAFKVLQGIREPMDGSAGFHYLMGRIRKRRNDPEAALEFFQNGLKKLGVANDSYVCGECSETYAEWQGWCRRCGTWSSIELDVGKEQLAPEDLGMVPIPYLGGYGPVDTWDVQAEDD